MNKSNIRKFDSIIIGSGQAGTPLAFKLAAEGETVAFIEKEHFGGTCLNIGCTPTKTYVASARRIWDAKHGEELGIDIPVGAKANLKKIKARKNALIEKSVQGIETGLSKQKNITVFKGEAHFEGTKLVQVNGEFLEANNIFINVGGRPFIPRAYENIPYLTNQSILELEELPEHLIIVGGSYIGLEFGQMFARFGSKVTVIEQNDRIIKKEDKETSEEIQAILVQDGVDFRLQSECVSAQLNDDCSISVQINCSKDGMLEIKGSHLLLAVGRRPNTDQLQLEKTGLKPNEYGYIDVNDQLETNVSGIYALGDCNGRGAFTHTAYNDFEIIVENRFLQKDRKVSDRINTYALFVDPPLGRVGFTKSQAIAAGYKVSEGYRPMSKVSRAKEKGETHGFMQVLVDQDTNQILGATILGTGADEIISGITNLMYAKAPYTVLRDSVQTHPTVSELLPTILENLSNIN